MINYQYKIIALAALLLSNSLWAMTEQDQCLLQKMQAAEDDVTMSQLRELCVVDTKTVKQEVIVAPEKTVIPKEEYTSIAEQDTEEKYTNIADKAIDIKAGAELKPFRLIAHRPNYFLFGAYNKSGYGEDVFRDAFGKDDIDIKDTESQFQISLKVPLALGLFNDKMDIYGAYTNRSFWQLYSKDISAPFRDTNHEPELWAQWRPDMEILGFKNSANQFGFVHQSNGQAGSLSRSWNRLFANFIFSKDDLALSFKPWWRIPEDSEDDDNSDITDYLGHFQWGGAYKYKKHTVSMMMRNNIESGFSRGTTEFSWSFPIPHYKYVNGYLQFFNGYGQSLIDYDRHVNSIGVGISISDWL